jgi:hypothetical protein
LLTEQEIARSWRVLFRDCTPDEGTFAKAEALLEGLRAESPLRHRLNAELTEVRKLGAQKQKKAKPKPIAQRAK